MNINIKNISKCEDMKGNNDYEVILNGKEVKGTFTHNKRDGLSEYLRLASIAVSTQEFESSVNESNFMDGKQACLKVSLF